MISFICTTECGYLQRPASAPPTNVGNIESLVCLLQELGTVLDHRDRSVGMGRRAHVLQVIPCYITHTSHAHLHTHMHTQENTGCVL